MRDVGGTGSTMVLETVVILALGGAIGVVTLVVMLDLAARFVFSTSLVVVGDTIVFVVMAAALVTGTVVTV